jgi:hypothetical protein
MPATIEKESEALFVIRISGILTHPEMRQSQESMAREIDAGTRPRLLAILEDFTGWGKGEEWNDIDFFLSHGDAIAKIAIVGEPRWEEESLVFAGAGFRQTPVRFFPSDQMEAARAWLAER